MRRTFSLSYLLGAGTLGALLAFLGSDSAWAGENNGGLKPEALTVAFTKPRF